MVAIPRQPESLVESLFGRRAARREARDERARAAGRPVSVGPGVLALVGLVLADLMGTLMSCAAFTIGAFLWLTPVGFVALAAAVMLLEFKVLWSTKKLLAERAAER